MAELKTRFPRHFEAPLRTALSDTRVVAIVGPRQSGKTTLARLVAGDRPFFTLDDEQTRSFAVNGDRIVPFGDRLFAAPLSVLWS